MKNSISFSRDTSKFPNSQKRGTIINKALAWSAKIENPTSIQKPTIPNKSGNIILNIYRKPRSFISSTLCWKSIIISSLDMLSSLISSSAVSNISLTISVSIISFESKGILKTLIPIAVKTEEYRTIIIKKNIKFPMKKFLLVIPSLVENL